MAETGFFKSAGNDLSYSCTVPNASRRTEGILFVHAGGGNRLGPHRMFVELARKFNAQGYPTFRFDLTGCGDSTGAPTDNDPPSEIRDVMAATGFFLRTVDLKRVILFGISRGAWICFSTMAQQNLPIAGEVLLSTPVSNGKAAVKTFSNRTKEYLYKLRDPKLIGRLLTGRVNFRQVGQTLAHALKSSQRYESPGNILVKSQCPVLLIYGRNDPMQEESMSYYISRCEENRVPCDCHIIDNANHSFFHYKWKEQIFDITRNWLVSATGQNVK